MKLFLPRKVKAVAHLGLPKSIEGEKARPSLTLAKTIGDLFQSLSKFLMAIALAYYRE